MLIGFPPPDMSGWKVGLIHTDEVIEVHSTAIASSGSTYKYLKSGEKRYSHIVDPKTGYGITTPEVVTIEARECMIADVLASVLSLIGVENGAVLQEHFKFKILK